MEKETNKRFMRTAVFVNEIIYHTKSCIIMSGFIETERCYAETEYVITSKQLKELLRQNGNIGREIIERMKQMRQVPHSVPMSLNLIDIFGTTQILEAGQIEISPVVIESGVPDREPEIIWYPTFIESVSDVPARQPHARTA